MLFPIWQPTLHLWSVLWSAHNCLKCNLIYAPWMRNKVSLHHLSIKQTSQKGIVAIGCDPMALWLVWCMCLYEHVFKYKNCVQLLSCIEITFICNSSMSGLIRTKSFLLCSLKKGNSQWQWKELSTDERTLDKRYYCIYWVLLYSCFNAAKLKLWLYWEK